MKLATKETLDKFFASLAAVLSFDSDEPLVDPWQTHIESPLVCLHDMAHHTKFLLDGRLGQVVEPLLALRTEPHDGRKVDALGVTWCNIYDSTTNPLGDIGFFRAVLYSHKSPTTEP